MTDIALTEDDNGSGLIAHRLDCPVVALHREAERMIVTMIEISRFPADLKRHSCLHGDFFTQAL